MQSMQEAMEARREARMGGLEKILERHHRRLLLELQQWLDEQTEDVVPQPSEQTLKPRGPSETRTQPGFRASCPRNALLSTLFIIFNPFQFQFIFNPVSG